MEVEGGGGSSSREKMLGSFKISLRRRSMSAEELPLSGLPPATDCSGERENSNAMSLHLSLLATVDYTVITYYVRSMFVRVT